MTPDECAVKVLLDYDITGIPALSFKKVFGACNILCDEFEYNDPKYSGSLHRFPDHSIILVNTDNRYVPRQNFTKAHELGHFFLKHKGDKFECTTQDMKTNDAAHKPQELEANRFASSLLLPKDRIELLIDDDIFDISTISEIANTYLVSLSVATIRTISLLKGSWCAVWTKNGIVEWVVSSPAFRNITIKLGEQIKQGSIAYKCFNDGFQPYKGEYIKVPSDCWIKNPLIDMGVLELTKPLSSYNATLSLIKVSFS
ncbi:MAG: ImmA/IrrE family metallo-endopeptidase [Clostridiaceae bacterium]|nr:ImmA/IrrE family metallo-endopeptidase [Clostridiaceae bacterium]